MTANKLRDWFVNQRIPCKGKIKSNGKVILRVDWRYRKKIAGWLEEDGMRPVGVQFIVRGTLMPWECEWPLIVEIKI